MGVLRLGLGFIGLPFGIYYRLWPSVLIRVLTTSLALLGGVCLVEVSFSGVSRVSQPYFIFFHSGVIIFPLSLFYSLSAVSKRISPLPIKVLVIFLFLIQCSPLYEVSFLPGLQRISFSFNLIILGFYF